MSTGGTGTVAAGQEERTGEVQATWRENRAPTSRLPPLEIGEAWRRRELARFFALRDLQLRYKQTLFGVAWALLQPLGSTAILVLTLDRAADIPSAGLPYGLFVFGGLAIWFYVSHAVSGAAESLVEDPDLVTKVWFPRVLAPIGSMFSWLLDLGICLAALAVMLVVYGVAPGAQILTLPIWIIGAIGLAFATGLWLSALNVLYRDVRHTLGFMLQAWLLASPVLYSASEFSETGQALLALNPMTGLLDGFRWAALDAPPPPAVDLLSMVTGIAVLVTGWVYFRRVETQFADRI